MTSALDFRARTQPLAHAPTPRNRGGSEVLVGEKEISIVELTVSACAWGETIAVVFGVQFEHDDRHAHRGPPFFAGVRARVRWGIGTVTPDACGFEAVTDVLNGTVLLVPAENVCVLAKLFVRTPDDCPPPRLPKVRVSAGLAYGGVAVNSNTSRLTEPVFLKDSSDVIRVPVPRYALSMTVLGDGTAPIEATVVGIGGIRTPYQALMPLGNNRLSVENALPLPNGSRFVEIASPTAAAPTTAQVIFGLSL
jgi:hypothetical protein